MHFYLRFFAKSLTSEKRRVLNLQGGVQAEYFNYNRVVLFSAQVCNMKYEKYRDVSAPKYGNGHGSI